MLHSLFRVHRRQLSSLPSSRLSRRVHPPISQPTTSISQCSRRTHSKMSDSEDGVSFVLDEYNNVPVATKDLPEDPVKTLTKDELKEWAPFKVRISHASPSREPLHPASSTHTDNLRAQPRPGSPRSPPPSPAKRTRPTPTTTTPTSSTISPSTRIRASKASASASSSSPPASPSPPPPTLPSLAPSSSAAPP